MKLTVNQLRRIIAEEVEASLAEAPGFLGKLMGRGAPKSNYATPAKALLAAHAKNDRKAYDSAIDDLYGAFEGAIARGADPEAETEVAAAAMTAAGFKADDVEWFKRDMKDKEFWRKEQHKREDDRAAIESAAKSLLTDPELRREIVPLLNAKRREGRGTKAGKAASAAVTDYIAGAFPGLDAVAVHGAVNKIVERMYGSR